MEISEAIIKNYAKKIYGFAFSKTKNYHDAQDLSQEILISLCDKRIDFSEIENMDAYIFRICSYSWTNYYRKNLSKKNTVENIDFFSFLQDETDIEKEYIQKELFEKLRQEIMYLGKTKRTVTIMFYYENKTGDEISKILNIPASSVRWYIGETKKILKERIEMKQQNEIYYPVKYNVGHSGWTNDSNMHGLSNDVLMQNICYLCYSKALSIEEIARTLGVASVYLEDKIDKLLYMDYIKTVGNNKYQTTFFINNESFTIETAKLDFKDVMKYALPIYEISKVTLKNWRESGKLVGEYNDNFLMWSMLMPTAEAVCQIITDIVSEKMNLTSVCPKRKDGSAHYVMASLFYEGDIKERNDIDQDLKDFILNSLGYGIKTRNTENLSSLQYDISLFGGGWRDFDDKELKQLYRVCEIINNNETPNEYDMDAITNLVSKGYCRVDEGKPVILIPYIKNPKEGPTLIYDIDYFKKEMQNYMNVDEIVDICCKNVEHLKSLIPSLLDKNEINHILKNNAVCGRYEILYSLYKAGYISEPTDDEKKRICTLVCEINKS